jgi:hypothetical protein
MKKSIFRLHKSVFTISLSFLLLSAGIVFLNGKVPQVKTSVNLEQSFKNPPESSKPRVWWHWMNGNITKAGIKADLEWMKRTGIGGLQNFNVDLSEASTPQIVDKRLDYMTPEWKDAFRFATKLADSLGLELAIAGSPGWSESGGPWVKPSGAMKKLVWSELKIEGGQPFMGMLPKPPGTIGRFQNVGSHNGYYADAAVVAYRMPEKDISLAELNPKVSSSSGKFDLSKLTDNDLEITTLLPASPENEKSWIQFEFTKPETFQSITMALGGRGGDTYANETTIGTQVLEASNDGINFTAVIDLTKPYFYTQIAQITATFPPATAKFFRITFTSRASQTDRKEVGDTKVQGTQIAELELYSVPRVNRFEDKAGFTAASDIDASATPSVPVSDAISKNEVIDLSSKMQADGTLSWIPPAGRWVILRLGYSLTGSQNGPASPDARGYEVDKLSAEHVKSYFTHYLDQYKDATAGLMGKNGLQYLVTDSWEMATQNWTDNMMADFTNRRGYDIIPWLPVLTGRVVESAEASDRFLWDFRKTIGELFSENHYDQLTTLLHERGMGRYTESHEGGRAFVADGMEAKRTADIPMCALWAPGEFNGNNTVEPETNKSLDILESASVSHIYGQNLVAAESMTAGGFAWIWSPESLKPTADLELASGVNRFVIHCSVHQPVDDKIPGLGLGWFGQWFTRNETWAELAKPWTTYLARSSYMLQQGNFVADIIYFYGEDKNIVALFQNRMPDVPSGYNYDFVNADALVNVLSENNGMLTTRSGMSYRVLALDPNSKYMSLPVLRKICLLVKSGAIVIGEKPENTPSLSDDQSEFKILADELWNTEKGENKFGKGKVFAGQTIAEVLSSMKIKPDFEYTKPQNTTNIMFVHRKLNDAEIYWVNNRTNNTENIETTFRVEGKVPELWHAETCEIEDVSYKISDGRTTVPLNMVANDAVFVVFRTKSVAQSKVVPQPTETQLAVIDGSWNVSFQPNRGAPVQILLDRLTSWSENADSGVKYFSGTGSYTKTIQASASWFAKGSQIWLDLGTVKNLAEVLVNGKSIGIVWKSPFRIDLTQSLNPGKNKLEVKVTNLWVNRLIGDQQPGISKKITYTTQAFYEANSPLLPSGLLGPVRIVGLSKN